jgi:hypothetical protein
LLQSTFPFAFFAFGEDDNDNAFENLMLLSGLGLGMDASRRRGQAFSAAQVIIEKWLGSMKSSYTTNLL